MASNADIFEIRLRIDDPYGFIGFEAVADPASLPATPKDQYAYKIESDGTYRATELESGATESDYEKQELRVSDARIGAWIDSKGQDYATCQALKQIVTKLAKELTIKKSNAGAEDLEWTSLKDTYDYYKGLLSDCSENTRASQGNASGKWGKSKQPIIAGGNV